MIGISRVVVSGNSMSPAYNHGDWLIVRKLSGVKHRLRIGGIYLLQDPVRPGVKLLKRLKESRMEHGIIRYWVQGDNPNSSDSRDWGWIDSEQFLGKVIVRYKKGN